MRNNSVHHNYPDWQRDNLRQGMIQDYKSLEMQRLHRHHLLPVLWTRELPSKTQLRKKAQEFLLNKLGSRTVDFFPRMLLMQGVFMSQKGKWRFPWKKALTGDRGQPRWTISLNQDDQSYLLVYSFMLVLIQKILICILHWYIHHIRTKITALCTQWA